MTGHAINDTVHCLLIVTVHAAANTLLATEDPNWAMVLSDSDFFISGKALQSWFIYEDLRKNYFLVSLWLKTAILQTTRSQEQKLPMEQSPLLKTNWISSKQVHTFKKNLVAFPFECAQIDA